MTDSALRELERRFRATGEPEDGARWLRARLRSGDLPADRLDLAAYLGDPAAARARVDGPAGAAAEELHVWVHGLARWGKAPATRAALAAARMGLGRFEARHPGDGRLRGAIAAADAWIACPCSAHKQAVADAWQPAMEASRRPGLALAIQAPEKVEEAAAARTVALAVEAVWTDAWDATSPSEDPEVAAARVQRVVHLAALAAQEARQSLHSLLCFDLTRSGRTLDEWIELARRESLRADAAVRAAIRAALAPWVLGGCPAGR